MSPRPNTVSSRRKSCLACARGKRRCDLGFPQCERCLARRVTCVYPWISPQEAQDMAKSVSQGSRVTQEIPPHDDGLGQCGPAKTPQPWSHHSPAEPGESHANDTATSGSLVTSPLALAPASVPLLDEIIGRGRTLTFLAPDLQFQSCNKSYLDAGSHLHAPQPLHNIGIPTPSLQIASISTVTTNRVLRARAEYIASRLVLQVTALAESGQTAFIHHSHIETSPILREALAACALYKMRNSGNLSLIRSEIAKRAQLLVEATETAISLMSPVSLTSPTSPSSVNLDLLPAVQAMLIYQCMRRFSTGDAELQAQAELDAESLARWVGILQEHTQASHNKGFEGSRLQVSAWENWVQAESLRRTLIFAELLDTTHNFLRFGWYQGSEWFPKLSFTGQVALWEARSAAEWDQVRWQRLWFEIHLSSFRADIKAALPDDLDELGIIIWFSYDGVGPLKGWLNNDSKLLEKWGLSSQYS